MRSIKKVTLLFLIITALLTLLISCELFGSSASGSVSVTYVYNNEESYTEEVSLSRFSAPDEPKRTGYKFIGWCTDPELTEFYNFDEKPSRDITLYAKWDTDYVYLQREITTKAVLSNVKVETETSSISASGTSAKITQGSGVIFHNFADYYYVITNYHVTEGKGGYFKSYYVTDACGKRYNADFISGSADYDLAVLKFRSASGENLQVAKIDERIPSNRETLICLGAPNGRFNTVTYGGAVNYKAVDIGGNKKESNVSFDVLWLDAYAEHGSSGCAILDTDLEVVGITYAVATDQNGEFKYALVIPAEKINEFLATTGIKRD